MRLPRRHCAHADEHNSNCDTTRRGLDSQNLGSDGTLPGFDATAAHALYARILAPVAALLQGARHLFVVPDGALQSLPVGVLLTDLPSRPLASFADYRAAPWLAKRYATTVLPAVSSLRALRRFVRATAAPQPFLGIGDPALTDPPPDSGGAPRRGRGAAVRPAGLFRGGTADLAQVRELPSLPETADELAALARATGAAPTDLVLRQGATETAVRRELPLGRYRILAFATHGLLAGELTGLAEPALVLTPPAGESAPAEADGLLTASEIASSLKLDADWVILSACNTAASDGTPGAEGLSGLAKAFFYAGARSLLVSHWMVASQATVKLTTRMLRELERHPRLGRAEAQRRAMLSLLNDPEEPALAHPMFWAPFVVVGEGGTFRPDR